MFSVALCLCFMHIVAEIAAFHWQTLPIAGLWTGQSSSFVCPTFCHCLLIFLGNYFWFFWNQYNSRVRISSSIKKTQQPHSVHTLAFFSSNTFSDYLSAAAKHFKAKHVLFGWLQPLFSGLWSIIYVWYDFFIFLMFFLFCISLPISALHRSFIF